MPTYKVRDGFSYPIDKQPRLSAGETFRTEALDPIPHQLELIDDEAEAIEREARNPDSDPGQDTA